jgi:hypothetical protein
MTHQHLVRAECVPVGAAGRQVGDPLPCRRLHKFAQHGMMLFAVRYLRSCLLSHWVMEHRGCHAVSR